MKKIEERPVINQKVTTEENGWLAIMRLNKLWLTKEVRKSIRIGQLTIEYHWRSKDNLWGRFGGGWNWELGLQIGEKTILIHCLVFTIGIYLKEPQP